MTPYATPSTSTVTIPSTVTTPAPTVIITGSSTADVTPTATATAQATGSIVAPVTSAAGVAPYPSGAALPTTGWATVRPQNGTVPRPSGTANYGAPAPSATGASSATGSGSKPSSSIVAASGAGKVTFGLLAAVAPVFFALL